MAFDSGFMSAVLSEIRQCCTDARVDKVLQPDGDGIVLLLHTKDGIRRLSVSASNSAPKITLTSIVKDNPAVPPMFCMLLRKHLGGARLARVEQPDFERVASLVFSCRDEMGYLCEKKLICEIMGKCSNIILTDSAGKILAPLRSVDFSTSRVRQVLGGMTYEMPPLQDKRNPMLESEQGFLDCISSADSTMPADRFLTGHYRGIAPLTAREVVFRTTGQTDTPLGQTDPAALRSSFFALLSLIREERWQPSAVFDEGGVPREYAFFDIRQYGGMETRHYETFAELCDAYFGARDRSERTRQRAADVIRLIGAAQARLTRKLALQQEELAETQDAEKWQKTADLITANIYRLSRGMATATLTDYTEEEPREVTVRLDTRLTPSQNAQKLYKKYAKAKHARVILAEQMEKTREELSYLDSVEESLSRADTEAELSEIREELFLSGYASRMKNYRAVKHAPSKPMAFVSEGGYRILCGKNNIQNDRLTFQMASKGDIWFHVKGEPGSHVILFCDGEEPSEKDYTMAAEIAATNSKAKGDLIPVDYTRVRFLKKPSGAKPGFVIYSQNYTAYVKPDPKYRDGVKKAQD